MCTNFLEFKNQIFNQGCQSLKQNKKVVSAWIYGYIIKKLHLCWNLLLPVVILACTYIHHFVQLLSVGLTVHAYSLYACNRTRKLIFFKVQQVE